MNRLSLRNNRLKFKTAGKLLISLEEFIEYTPNSIKENRRMLTCNQLDLQTLGSQPISMPKNLPDHCSRGMQKLILHSFAIVPLSHAKKIQQKERQQWIHIMTRKKDDSNVATRMMIGVASSSSCSKSMFNHKTGMRRIRGSPKTTTTLLR